jgi:hypothetical protein
VKTDDQFYVQRQRAFEGWQNGRTLERLDGEWFLSYPDGGEITLNMDKDDPRGFEVIIGNTYHSFLSRNAAEWYLWDNWSECHYL